MKYTYDSPDDLLIRYEVGTYPNTSTLDVEREMFDESVICRSKVNSFVGHEATVIHALLTGGATLDSLTKDSSDSDKKKTEETIFQLKCAIEHLFFLYQTESICPIDFDIDVINECISQLENLKEE